MNFPDFTEKPLSPIDTLDAICKGLNNFSSLTVHEYYTFDSKCFCASGAGYYALGLSLGFSPLEKYNTFLQGKVNFIMDERTHLMVVEVNDVWFNDMSFTPEERLDGVKNVLADVYMQIYAEGEMDRMQAENNPFHITAAFKQIEGLDN